jgi:hypothetical protein
LPCLLAQQLMDDYVCALRKKVLLQGRLFVFDHHLGFHCNLFGYRKKYTIPLAVRHWQTTLGRE